MALYDDKYWLLSHIRNSFITTDDTGNCRVVMSGEDTQHIKLALERYPDPDLPDEIDDPVFSTNRKLGDTRPRTNTQVRIEKLEQAKNRAALTKVVKWETAKSNDTTNDLFVRKEPKERSKQCKSLLSERLVQSMHLPKNPYMEYRKFDGSVQNTVPTKNFKIFFTMLSEEQKNVPCEIVCVATARVYDLIGLALLKCSNLYGDISLKPVSHYGLYIMLDGELELDLSHLEPKEVVSKYGFKSLGLVEHKDPAKFVKFDVSKENSDKGSNEEVTLRKSTKESSWETTNQETDLQLIEALNKEMKAPLYQSYTVFIITKMRAKAEIHLGVSGEKIEIDPIHQNNFKFSLVKQKSISHPMDSIAWCELLENKGNKATFRVVYSTSFGNGDGPSNEIANAVSSFSPLQTSASFKHYDFEAYPTVAEEIVQKINRILELRSSLSRKEYMTSRNSRDSRQSKFKSFISMKK